MELKIELTEAEKTMLRSSVVSYKGHENGLFGVAEKIIEERMNWARGKVKEQIGFKFEAYKRAEEAESDVDLWKSTYEYWLRRHGEERVLRSELETKIQNLIEGLESGTAQFMEDYERAGESFGRRMSGETAAMVVETRSVIASAIKQLLEKEELG